MSSFETTNSIFIISDENKSFAFSIPGNWRFPNFSELGIIDKLNKLLKLRSQTDIELHVEEVRKRGNQTKKI